MSEWKTIDDFVWEKIYRRCTSYIYFNNSWSTNENMIAGRPWLILNWSKKSVGDIVCCLSLDLGRDCISVISNWYPIFLLQLISDILALLRYGSWSRSKSAQIELECTCSVHAVWAAFRLHWLCSADCNYTAVCSVPEVYLHPSLQVCLQCALRGTADALQFYLGGSIFSICTF